MSPVEADNPYAAIQALVNQSGLQHIAIIMDGNRRWAEQHHLPKVAGHGKGVDALRKIVRHADDIGLKVLTVYAFSTENWRRSPEEVNHLMTLFGQVITAEVQSLCDNNVRIRFIGDLDGFPEGLRKLLNHAVEKTWDNTGLQFQVALNYGSRAELVHCVKILVEDALAGKLKPEDISEDTLSQALYTHGLPDPDLLIRTGGEHRLSNYLLWQLAYAEFYVTDILWPDFSEKELEKAVTAYADRERRYGK